MSSFACGSPADPAIPPESRLAMPLVIARKPRRRKALDSKCVARNAAPSHAVVDDLNVGFDPANLRRCPGCGGLVYLWPCLACRSRNAA